MNKTFKKVYIVGYTIFFTKFNVLNTPQFGFRESHSTTLALSELVESALSSLDEGNAVCAVLLDLSNAFESVDKKKS